MSGSRRCRPPGRSSSSSASRNKRCWSIGTACASGARPSAPARRTPHADRHLHHPAEESGSRILDLQRGENALHAEAHVGRHCDACRAAPRLSRVARLRAVAGGFRREALRGDYLGHDRDRDRSKERCRADRDAGPAARRPDRRTPAGPLPASGFEWQPDKSPRGAVSVIFSLPDSAVYVYRNGVQIGRAPLRWTEFNPRGSHVYSALAGGTPRGAATGSPPPASAGARLPT